MSLSITNTLTGEREAFEPISEGTVLLYLCGLTTSDPAHLGHARAWVHTDVVHRWLEHLGYEVRHVENFTDVNEKIVARVGEDGSSEADVAEGYVADLLRDMRGLNLKRADVYPRVTEHVPEIIELIEALIEAGHAYESRGSVYFDVTSFGEYGKLSNQDVGEMEAQGPEEERAEKHNPADFALWKAGGVAPDEIAEHRHEGAAPAEDACETAMTWDSPWGEGRPGWHIECSAMSTTHLGETFDVHVAGQDLVFPHNENEIAQAEAATGEQFARYWMHVGLLETPADDDSGGTKMSSSLGNYFAVDAALDAFGANAVRTFLLSTKYGQRQTYSESTVHEAVERAGRLERAHERACEAADGVDAHTKTTDGALRDAVEETREEFQAAMNDDFNTREALRALDDLSTAVNRHLDHYKTHDYPGLKHAIDAFEELGGRVLGLVFGDNEPAGEVRLVEDLIELVLSIREEERAAGNYDRADSLRDRLDGLGVTVEDEGDGVTYRIDG
ncbi:MAG: cysteine--tRNA ligase [Halobacteriales archaeon]